MAKKKPKTSDQPEGSAAENGDTGNPPGRPPGASNHDYSTTVVVRGAVCPHCGAGDIVVVKGLAVFASSVANGVRVDRHRMRCRECTERFMRLTHTPVQEGDDAALA